MSPGAARVQGPARPAATHPVRLGAWAALLVLSSALIPLPAAASVSVEIQGLAEPLAGAVRTQLALTRYAERDVSPAQLRRLMAEADAEIERALEAFGYYQPTIRSDVTRSDETDYTVRFAIEVGEPVVVRGASIHVRGAAGSLPGVQEALRRFTPRPGERLDHAAYEASKERIRGALREAGHLDAKPLHGSVAVSIRDRSADIELVFEPGERHRFGTVRFSETPFPESFLLGYVPWEEGDPFSFDRLLELQDRLVESGYFESVSVQPDLDTIERRTVPVEVLLVTDERTAYSAGLFLSTDIGPGGRLGLDRRWVNRSGHTFRSQLEYASDLQRGSLDYGIPYPGDRGNDLRLGAALSDEITDTSESQTARIAAAAVRRHWHGVTRSLGVQLLTGDFEVADERRSSTLLYTDLSLSSTRVDSAFFAQRGQSWTLGLRAAPGLGLSDARFVQLQAQGRWIRSLTESTRLLLHAELGGMSVDDFDDLPPELRFFAGGDRSIRGFAYEEIGETNRAGGVIGGKYLAVGGIELEQFLLQRWGVAAFVDAGDAFLSGFDLNVGAGVGLRWKSPIGLVRLDVARPVVSDFDDGWRIHVVIGPDL